MEAVPEADPPLTLSQRWLRATAWVNAALTRRYEPGVLEQAAPRLAALLPWEDRRLLIALLIDASGEDRAELVDWLGAALDGLGQPPAPRFGTVREDAEAWAALASEPELKAWLMACIARLPGADRLKFLEAVRRQALAAVGT